MVVKGCVQCVIPREVSFHLYKTHVQLLILHWKLTTGQAQSKEQISLLLMVYIHQWKQTQSHCSVYVHTTYIHTFIHMNVSQLEAQTTPHEESGCLLQPYVSC